MFADTVCDVAVAPIHFLKSITYMIHICKLILIGYLYKKMKEIRFIKVALRKMGKIIKVIF